MASQIYKNSYCTTLFLRCNRVLSRKVNFEHCPFCGHLCLHECLIGSKSLQKTCCSKSKNPNPYNRPAVEIFDKNFFWDWVGLTMLLFGVVLFWLEVHWLRSTFSIHGGNIYNAKHCPRAKWQPTQCILLWISPFCTTKRKYTKDLTLHIQWSL